MVRENPETVMDKSYYFKKILQSDCLNKLLIEQDEQNIFMIAHLSRPWRDVGPKSQKRGPGCSRVVIYSHRVA